MPGAGRDITPKFAIAYKCGFGTCYLLKEAIRDLPQADGKPQDQEQNSSDDARILDESLIYE
jgi:hypothetical protein